MTGRYKGSSQKGAPDVGDLETLARIHRELQDMGAAINLHHPCQHPIAAARATVFAAWTEISGEAQSWSFPTSEMLSNGRTRRSLRQAETDEHGARQASSLDQRRQTAAARPGDDADAARLPQTPHPP